MLPVWQPEAMLVRHPWSLPNNPIPRELRPQRSREDLTNASLCSPFRKSSLAGKHATERDSTKHRNSDARLSFRGSRENWSAKIARLSGRSSREEPPFALFARSNGAKLTHSIEQCKERHLRRTRPVSALDRPCDGISSILIQYPASILKPQAPGPRPLNDLGQGLICDRASLSSQEEP